MVDLDYILGEYEAIYNTFASKYKSAKNKAVTLNNLT